MGYKQLFWIVWVAVPFLSKAIFVSPPFVAMPAPDYPPQLSKDPHIMMSANPARVERNMAAVAALFSAPELKEMCVDIHASCFVHFLDALKRGAYAGLPRGRHLGRCRTAPPLKRPGFW